MSLPDTPDCVIADRDCHSRDRSPSSTSKLREVLIILPPKCVTRTMAYRVATVATRRGYIYAQRSMRFKTRVMPTCVTSSAPDLTFVRRGHHETRTHAASRSGTSGPVLCCLDLSAIHGSMAFQVASGIEKRNRADVS